MDKSLISMDDLEGLLSPLDDEAKNTVMLAVTDTWRVPPMTRETVVGEELGDRFLKRWPSVINEESGYLDFTKIDQMMSTGQVAYPMMLKKAPIISIVRSASGFTIKSADEKLAKVAHANLQEILPKRIEEILTYLEYGAYYGEVTYEPVFPQDYGLPEEKNPYWVIEDFNGVHPSTIVEILRSEKSKAFEGFVQQPLGYYEPIKVGTDRALIIPNDGMFGRLSGNSVLEPVYVWWFWYELVWRAFLRFLQRAGVGVVVVKAPSRGRVEIQGKSVDNMQWALQMASSLHRTNYAAVPSDMDSDSGHPLWVIDYLKMGQNEGNQFIAALELLANNIKNHLLTGDSGPAGEGAEFEVMLDTERILGHIGMYITEYVLPKMFHWNGSSTTRASLEFQGANSRVLPLLFKLMAVAGNTAGDALQNVDWRLLFNKGGVPVLTEEEVEALKKEKEEKQKEMFEQKQQAANDKAKMQPGGEGRWSKERDEKGESEKLEMVREALNVPLIALGPEQVAELEHLGLRAEPAITLYNPYHDEQGRFTSKERSVGTPSFGRGDEMYKEYEKMVREESGKSDEWWDEYAKDTDEGGSAFAGIIKSQGFKKTAFATIAIAGVAGYIAWLYKRGMDDEAAVYKDVISELNRHQSEWRNVPPSSLQSKTIEGIMDEVNRRWPKDTAGLETGPPINIDGIRKTLQEFLDSDNEVLVFTNVKGDLPGSSKIGDLVYIDRWAAKAYLTIIGGNTSLEYYLFNPYHDELGRFASKARNVFTPENIGIAGAVGMIAGGVGLAGSTAVHVVTDAVQKRKKKRGNSTAISIKIGDRTYKASYSDIKKGTRKVASVSFKASAFSLAAATLGLHISRNKEFEKARSEHESYSRRRAEEMASGKWTDARENIYRFWSDEHYKQWGNMYRAANQREAWKRYRAERAGWWRFWRGKTERGATTKAWPSGATQEQFKKMHRDLAKAFHPDVSGSDTTDIMQKINEAYSNGDWHAIEELWQDLGKSLEILGIGPEYVDGMVFTIATMMEAVNDGAEFITFPPDITDIFPHEDGYTYIDADMVRNIYNAFSVLLTTGDYELEGDHFDPFRLNYLDGGELLLYNPYHDEQGRFTSEERAVSIGAAKKNAGIQRTEQLDDGSVLFAGDDWEATVRQSENSKIDSRTFDQLSSAVGVATGALNKMGIAGHKKGLVTIYEDLNEFVKQYEKDGGKNIFPEAYAIGTNVHLGPFVIHSTRTSFVGAVTTIAHELFHTRRNKTDNPLPVEAWIEEGLASAIEICTRIGMKNGDFSLTRDDSMRRFLDESWRSAYAGHLEKLIRFTQESGGSGGWRDVLFKWFREHPYDVEREIKAIEEKLLEIADDVIWLFNPYHDEQGRFTSKDRATKISGIMENAGVKDVKYDSDRDGNSTALFSGAWDGIVKVDRGKFTTIPEEYWEGTLSEFESVVWDDYLADMRTRDKHVLDNVGIASNALADLGIKTTHRTITAHHGNDTFLARWSEAGGNFLNQPSAFVTELGDAVHLGPWITGGLMWKRGKEAIEYIGIVAHEMFHIREWRSRAIGRQFEEGLASVAEILVNMKLGAPLGGYEFTPERFNRFVDKLEIGVDTGVYDKWAKHISNAASKMKGSYLSNLLRLLNTANPGAEKEILDIMGDWPEETWEELQEIENTTKLFNPYHDEQGRFTSKERAVGQGGLSVIANRMFGKDKPKFRKDDDGAVFAELGENNIYVHGFDDRPTLRNQLTLAVALGVESLKTIGVKLRHRKFIHAYERGEDYKEAIGYVGDIAWAPRGIAKPKLGLIALHPGVIKDLARGVPMPEARLAHSIGTIAHELYHVRDNPSRRKGISTFTEEGLATIASHLSSVILSGGDRFLRKRNDRDLFNDADILSPRQYRELADLIVGAAMAKGGGGKWGSVLNDWVRRGTYAVDREIFNLLFEHFGYTIGDLIDIGEDAVRATAEYQDSVQLFNPYHDEQGRFTSKERAVGISGLIDSETRKNLEIKKIEEWPGSALFSGDGWKVSVETEGGSLEPVAESELKSLLGLAGASMRAIGIRGAEAGANIVAHLKEDTFKAMYHKVFGELPSEPIAGFVDFLDKIHLAPDTVFGAIMALRYSRSIKQKGTDSRWYDEALCVMMHEMYHIRGGWRGRGQAEEGLASIAEIVGLVGLRTGDYDLRTLGGLKKFTDLRLGHPYASEIGRLVSGAEKIGERFDKDWRDIILEWMKSGDEKAFREIQRYIPIGGSKRLESYKLFNPYHDVSGRFTEQQHAVRPLPDNKFHTHGEIDKKAAFRTADAASLGYERMKQKPGNVHMYSDMEEYVTAACGRSRSKSACVKSANNSYAFYANGGIHVGPKGARLALKDRQAWEHIMAHEAYHSRKRKGGKLGPTFRTGKKYQYDNFAKRDIEEATTDMLSMRGIFGTDPIYPRQAGAIALMAYQLSGRNQKKAWQIVDDLHYHINDWDYIGKLMTDFAGGEPTGGWTGSTIYAMLAELQKASAGNNHLALGWMLEGGG